MPVHGKRLGSVSRSLCATPPFHPFSGMTQRQNGASHNYSLTCLIMLSITETPFIRDSKQGSQL